jgi:hypothetical protein
VVERDLAKVDVAGPTPVSRLCAACFLLGKHAETFAVFAILSASFSRDVNG